MKNLRPALLAAGLVIALCTGCRKREDPVKVIEEAESALPPAEQMPPQDRVVKADSLVEPGSTFKIKTPAAALAPGLAAEAGYEEWFKKYHLDLQDSKMLDADGDGDGFSNRDEFMANTDPRDPESRPGVHAQLKLKQYTEVRIPVVLEGVTGETARIRRLDGEERSETVRAGDTVRGLRWKVERMQGKQDVDKNGYPVDLSSLTLTDIETNERTILAKNLPARTGDSFAELTSEDGGHTIKVKQGVTFNWPLDGGPAFKVIDLRPDQVVVQEVATKKMWTIVK